ncbi:MAG: hypothetical protein IPP15_12755 [Saprospiraceae bacterium]|uniref:Uncharacterized protein n=1 Tax=Candidatus Opimibacter skivensis TaxID=2982028 RepID=A0A9D7SYQ6_9BACT|nr:hypothetical protein [Candidatus Opimibacter skivensis]
MVKQEMPVYFRAPKVKDISRALALQKDLGMKMVISDAEEAWYLKDQFKTGTIPLVLSLALPEDKSEKKAEAKAEAKEKKVMKRKLRRRIRSIQIRRRKHLKRKEHKV